MESLLTTLLIFGVVLVLGVAVGAGVLAYIIGSKLKKAWKFK
jgi:hypothetical protein